MSTATLSSPLVTAEQAAEMLSVTIGTLSVWRCVKRYDLPFVKVGRSIRYRLRDLEAFLERRTVGAVEPE
jgi:excisionase family DNA binding protein